MNPTIYRRLGVTLVCLAGAAIPSSAWAREQVTLRNGFTLECSHHTVVGDRVRFYLGPDENSYQELASQQIAAIDTLPDPPAPPPPPAAAPVTASSSPSAPSAAEMRQLLEHAGAEHDIDVELLASVIKAESAFNVRAVSHAGARGLMQLMPETARQMGVQDAFRADQNIAGGTAYLDSLLKLYKDNLALALAAYNAGPAAVARYHGVPPYRETHLYVARVMNEFYRRKQALPVTAKKSNVAASAASATALALR